ncbi:hypothetical protein GCM10009844_41760 [Nocardioides koreensis]|uniref:WXG100 family type VII secretion target n=1 Tax=Nocardioides koreensis TaxID=433651 RepID=A0ABN3A7I0_9ACTN
MNDQVAVSWQGMDQLVSMTRDQYLNLSEASGFICSAQLGNTGAFSGILGLFKGSYTSALETVTDSLDKAMTGARELSARIGDVREDLRGTDSGVAELHTRINAAVECQGYVPGSGGGVPQLDDQVVNANDLADAPWHMTGPRPPGWVPEATLNSPLGLVDATMSMADNADNTGQGLDHDDDIDDYLGRNGR